jgi:cellulose biosynthesis protein BcsQ
VKPITIGLWFGKGGCGKSMSAYALSSYLSKKYQTLAVDMDSQATLSSSLIEKLPESSTYNWLMKSQSFDDVVIGRVPTLVGIG